MNHTLRIPKIGIEEEYQIIDPISGQLSPRCNEVMTRMTTDCEADIQHELHLSQIEMASPVCESMEDVSRVVRSVRSALANAAMDAGCRLVAAGTNPLPVAESEDMTPKPRYRQMAARYQQIVRDLRIFGCHVHVEMEDRNLGIEVLNRTRCWLPVLQAISANSPFLDGEDTGYASYRRELWVQFPLAGPPRAFADYDQYQSIVQHLVQAKAITDATNIYWDIRLPEKIPTIEYRVFDVFTNASHAVAIAAIVRALVIQSMSDAKRNILARHVDDELLVMALWQAARYGITGDLILADESQCKPASESIDKLLNYVSEALIETGDEAVVMEFINEIRTHGTGADRQRQFAQQHGVRKLALELADLTVCNGPCS